MSWQYLLYVPPLVIAAVVSAALSLFAWRRRPAPGATPFALIMLAVSEWSLGYALELGYPGLQGKLFWAGTQYIGIVIIPVAWLVFALQYTRRDRWLSPRNQTLLAILPVLTLLMVLTNDAHRLIWYRVELDTSFGIPILDVTYGAGFWINAAYSYLLLFLGTAMFIQALFRSPNLYRGQAGVLLIGALAPWLGNAVYLSGLSPLPHLDLTLFGFTLSGLIMYWGLYRFRLLDITPVARDALIESMDDSVIVLDNLNRIVDLNPSAERIINRTGDEIIGQSAEQVFAAWPGLVEHFRGETQASAEIILEEGDTQYYYDLRISPLYDRRGGSAGRLVVLGDTTERVQADKAVRESEDRYRNLVELSPETIVVHCEGKFVYANAVGLKLLGASSLDEVMNRPIGDFVHPDYRELTLERVRKSYEEKLPTELVEEKMIRLDGQVIDVEVVGEPITYQGKPATQVVIRDITERKIAEEKLRRQLKELTVLHAVAAAGAESTSEDALIEQATLIVGTALYPNNFGLLLLDEASGVLHEHVSYQRERAEEQLLTVPLGQGIAGTVAATGEPMRIADVRAEPAYLDVYPGILSELCVPLKVDQRVIGVINAESTRLEAFTEDDERLLLTLASQLATAIEKVRLFEEVRQLAITDPLTGLYNRRHFFELAEREFDRARRYHHPLSVIMMDLDYFKQVNDTYGHLVGDQVLQTVAQRLQQELREVDLLGRYGGEEFTILLPETDFVGVHRVAERLCQRVGQTPIDTEREPVSITISLGVVGMDESCTSLDVLIDRADQALYTAKQGGGNRVCVWLD